MNQQTIDAMMMGLMTGLYGMMAYALIFVMRDKGSVATIIFAVFFTALVAAIYAAATQGVLQSELIAAASAVATFLLLFGVGAMVFYAIDPKFKG